MNFITLMRRFTIRTRMFGAIAMVLFALLATGGAGLAGLQYSRTVNDSFIHNDFVATSQIAELRSAMSALRAHEKDMIIQYENAVEAGAAKAAWLKTMDEVQVAAKALAQVV